MARSGPAGAGLVAWLKAEVTKAKGKMKDQDLNIRKGQMF